MLLRSAVRLGVGATYLDLSFGKLSVSGWEENNFQQLDLPPETLALRGVWLGLTSCFFIGAAIIGHKPIHAHVQALCSSSGMLSRSRRLLTATILNADRLGWVGSAGSGAVVGGTLGTWALRRMPGRDNLTLARRQSAITSILGLGTILAWPSLIAGGLFALSSVAGCVGVVYLMPSATPKTPSIGAVQGAAARDWLRRKAPRVLQDVVPGWEPYASEEARLSREAAGVAAAAEIAPDK